jgi:hypothetical protein
MSSADDFFFVIGQDQLAATRETTRELLKGFCFTLTSVFITQGVTNLNGQFRIGDIKVDYLLSTSKW